MVNYFTAPIIERPAKLDTDTGIVTIQDLIALQPPRYVTYTPAELRLIEQAGGMTIILHAVKKMSGGVIVGVRGGVIA